MNLWGGKHRTVPTLGMWSIVCLLPTVGYAARLPESSSPEPTSAEQRSAGRFLLQQGAPDYSTHATEHYLLAYAGLGKWVPGTAELLESFHRRFLMTFSNAGFSVKTFTDRLVWLCFPDGKSYASYGLEADSADVSWLPCYYSSRTNRVALAEVNVSSPQPVRGESGLLFGQVVERERDRPSDDHLKQPLGRHVGQTIDPRKICHEAAHQLAFNVGLQKRGVMYPLWVSEGLATNFEVTSTALSNSEGDNPPRRRDLLAARASGQLIPMEDFVSLVGPIADQPAEPSAIYAEAWGVWRFLFQQHPADLRRYLASLLALPRGPRAERTLKHEFVEAFGSTQRLEAAWERFISRLEVSDPDASKEPPAARLSGKPAP